jgi:hypothetical protein
LSQHRAQFGLIIAAGRVQHVVFACEHYAIRIGIQCGE